MTDFNDPPLHIVLTSDAASGVWDMTTMLATELNRAGHLVSLLAYGEPSPVQSRQADRAGVELFSAELSITSGDPRPVRLLAKLAADLRPDIVHVHAPELISSDLTAPVVLTAHGDRESRRRWLGLPAEENPAGLAAVRLGLAGADALVAVSHFVARDLRDQYKLRRAIDVIPNGWPVMGLSPAPFESRPRATLVAGRVWDPAKNIGLVGRAALGWDPGRVMVAGSQRDPETGALTAVDPPLVALGHQPRGSIDRLLDAARVCLAPSRYEPFGLVPLQAAIAGCALLLADIPSFQEIWGDAAWYFRSNDPVDLSRQWRRLLDDAPFAADLARRARRRAWDRYSASLCASRYLEVYHRLRQPTPSQEYVPSWAVV